MIRYILIKPILEHGQYIGKNVFLTLKIILNIARNCIKHFFQKLLPFLTKNLTKLLKYIVTDKKYDPTLPTQIRLLINQYLSTDVRKNIPQFYRWVEKHKNFSQSLGVLGALKRFENNKTSSL